MRIVKTTKIGNKEYKEPVNVITDMEIKPKRKKRAKKEQEPVMPVPTAIPRISADMLTAAEQLTPEKAQAIVMTALADLDKIKLHSELSDDRVINLMAISVIGDCYNSNILKSIPPLFLELLVSKDRQGRREQIDMVKAYTTGMREQGLLARFRGLF